MEWPTVAVAAAIASGLTATVALHEHLPAVAEVVVIGLLAAWYNSLQHEVIHGHPTPWQAINTAIAIAPLGLVVPFRRYRAAAPRAPPDTGPHESRGRPGELLRHRLRRGRRPARSTAGT